MLSLQQYQRPKKYCNVCYHLSDRQSLRTPHRICRGRRRVKKRAQGGATQFLTCRTCISGPMHFRTYISGLPTCISEQIFHNMHFRTCISGRAFQDMHFGPCTSGHAFSEQCSAQHIHLHTLCCECSLQGTHFRTHSFVEFVTHCSPHISASVRQHPLALHASSFLQVAISHRQACHRSFASAPFVHGVASERCGVCECQEGPAVAEAKMP